MLCLAQQVLTAQGQLGLGFPMNQEQLQLAELEYLLHQQTMGRINQQ
jgi:hypothetical protein